MSVSVIVLAAGAGTRMRSELPKPLHPVCGRPMVLHVIDAVIDVDPDQVIVVIGHGADQVADALDAQAPEWARLDVAVQAEQHGTGHAAAIGLAALATREPDDTVIILPGDTPLLRRETIAALCAARVERGEAATVLSSTLDDPTGYGRIVRDENGRVIRIVEQRDASEAELAIREWNTGVYAVARGLLAPALDRLGTDNAQGEYYLTDVIATLAADGHLIGTVVTEPEEAHGVNDRDQLAEAEALMKRRLN
jgi:bifunctional UDP-N-acetylglucosamine pyrophosphorylase/glucosamine-1-phosphate N-acetyltransferase